MIVCAGSSESFLFAVSIGIGMIDSAINLTKIIALRQPKNIIFIGTAGLYKEGEILNIYESDKASNTEISFLNNQSYTPIERNIESIVSRETIITNSSNFITTDEKSSNTFFEHGYFMENMEFYSVLKVCNYFNIPAYGIFATTNFCNQKAHEDFIKNHSKAKQLLKDYVKTKGLI